jgi:hypothetical protein
MWVGSPESIKMAPVSTSAPVESNNRAVLKLGSSGSENHISMAGGGWDISASAAGAERSNKACA